MTETLLIEKAFIDAGLPAANGQTSFADHCHFLRDEIKKVEKLIRSLKQLVLMYEKEAYGDFGEVMANVTLAIRHAEDSRMRIGKAIQYSNTEDQKSLYDK